MRPPSQMLGMLALSLAGAASPAGASYINTTVGGPLRPGVYGRVEIGRAPPPPLIYSQPVIVSQTVVPAGIKPVYLYVPPGQARKWARYCARYQACGVPVYFVRMDNSPSKLGKWKSRSSDNDRLGARVAAGPPQPRGGAGRRD